jgi:hypothetical protein
LRQHHTFIFALFSPLSIAYVQAPWQTDEWRVQMREQLRPNAYLRLIENR